VISHPLPIIACLNVHAARGNCEGVGSHQSKLGSERRLDSINSSKYTDKSHYSEGYDAHSKDSPHLIRPDCPDSNFKIILENPDAFYQIHFLSSLSAPKKIKVHYFSIGQKNIKYN
jgi:hypothetical protein